MRKNEAVYGISYPSNRKGFIYALARRESSADLDKDDTFNQKALSVINKLGYAGLFQYGNLALIDIGYKTQNGNWTGKNGATSLKAFLASREIQIAAINLSINLWCERLRVNGFNEYYGKTVNGIEITESGCIAGCHLVGSGGLASFLNMPGNLKINRKTGKRHNEFDGNNIHISHYIKLFAGYDLENCCKRKVRIKLKELNGLPLTGKSVTIRSSYQGKYSKSSFEVTHLTDVDGELPVIVRHPGARIVLEINGRESETIIQSADSTQPYSIIASDIKVSAPLAEKGKPEPKKQGAKETVPKQDSTEEQNFTKDVDFHIAMREGDTRKPISNVKFTLVYKGNPKQHITNAQGVKENIIAEAGQKVEICMAGEGALQPIASFTVTENLRGTTVDILLPVHTFSVIVVDTKGKPVSSAEFGIFYRGRELTKKTDQEGRLKIKALVGFVYGFGNKGNPLLYLRCLQSVSVRRISVNATAVKVAQENITGKVHPHTAQQPDKTIEGQKAEQQEPVQQRNTHTEKGGKPLTIVEEEMHSHLKVKIRFATSVTEYQRSLVSHRTKQVLMQLGSLAGKTELVITSTIRTPEKQAELMYNPTATYGKNGREVIEIANKGKQQKESKKITLQKMVQKIKELEKQGKRVSLHCVSEEEYRKLNVIDLGINSNGLASTRSQKLFYKHCSSLMRKGLIKKVLYPGNNKREKAFHLEINQ